MCKTLWVVIFLVLVSGCNKNKSELNTAFNYVEKLEFEQALELFEKIIIKNEPGFYSIKAAQEAARICFYELKLHEKAINFYQHLILYSKDSEERVFAQKQIAEIYFNTLKYKEAIEAYHRLLLVDMNLVNAGEYRLRIAKSYYHINNFYQASSEVDALLKSSITEENKFKAILLKANIFITEKKFDKAIDVLKEIILTYPLKAFNENVHVSLSIVYEDKKDYKNAIDVLVKYKDKILNQDYLKIRIHRLTERLKNAPGAKGLNRK